MSLGSGTLLVATRNPGKLRELRDLATTLGLVPRTLDEAGVSATAAEEALEQFDSFEANAVAKARYYAGASGLPTVADDSGLVVDALGGGPGVRSRRWAGAVGAEADVSAANNRALLRELEGVTARGARFECVVAFATGNRVVTASGRVAGRIAAAPVGEGGFGYDPLFVPDELDGRTFAELTLAEKQRVSHRARAFAALARALEAGSGLR